MVLNPGVPNKIKRIKKERMRSREEDWQLRESVTFHTHPAMLGVIV
jgi:hypothetical protein